MALIRYPGSKERLAYQILRYFPLDMSGPLFMDHNRWDYREPFFGAGAIGFRILELLPPSCKAWLNDIDYGIISLWQSVLQMPDQLSELIHHFTPSTQLYNEYKKSDGDRSILPIEAAFRKLALHQMSYSGLGAMSGGPLGGQSQGNSRYRIDCRWSRERLQKDVFELHSTLSNITDLRLTCGDYSRLFAPGKNVFMYLDPPYYQKGKDLYKYAMSPDDHFVLAKRLRATPHNWIMSYDDSPVIRGLYNWAHIEELEATYTVYTGNGNRPKNKEILIIDPKLMRRAD